MFIVKLGGNRSWSIDWWSMDNVSQPIIYGFIHYFHPYTTHFEEVTAFIPPSVAAVASLQWTRQTVLRHPLFVQTQWFIHSLTNLLNHKKVTTGIFLFFLPLLVIPEALRRHSCRNDAATLVRCHVQMASRICFSFPFGSRTLQLSASPVLSYLTLTSWLCAFGESSLEDADTRAWFPACGCVFFVGPLVTQSGGQWVNSAERGGQRGCVGTETEARCPRVHLSLQEASADWVRKFREIAAISSKLKSETFILTLYLLLWTNPGVIASNALPRATLWWFLLILEWQECLFFGQDRTFSIHCDDTWELLLLPCQEF